MRDLIPRNIFPFQRSSFWDDDNWPMGLMQNDHSGLSVYEDKDKVFVEAAIPGLDPKDVEVTVQDDTLWIRGEAKEEESNKDKKYYRKSSSSVSYRVSIPENADISSEPEASYKHGLMVVSFKKSTKAEPKKIHVKMNE